jgi:hypothetical protein
MAHFDRVIPGGACTQGLGAHGTFTVRTIRDTPRKDLCLPARSWRDADLTRNSDIRGSP